MFVLDGFMSSLGCQNKERVGHMLSPVGRDCENRVVEDRFERMCFCRYHWCNHPDYYYGAADTRLGHWACLLAAIIVSRML